MAPALQSSPGRAAAPVSSSPFLPSPPWPSSSQFSPLPLLSPCPLQALSYLDRSSVISGVLDECCFSQSLVYLLCEVKLVGQKRVIDITKA